LLRPLGPLLVRSTLLRRVFLLERTSRCAEADEPTKHAVLLHYRRERLVRLPRRSLEIRCVMTSRCKVAVGQAAVKSPRSCKFDPSIEFDINKRRPLLSHE